MYCADAYTSRSPCVAAHARIPLADSCRRGWLLVVVRSPPGNRVDLPDGQLTRRPASGSAGGLELPVM
jgi:hypothetical protein